MLKHAGASALLAIASVSVAWAQTTAIPVETFVKHPIYSDAKISPNGDYIAITVERGEQDVLTILRTSNLQPVKINILPDKKSVGEFHWTNPDRLVFNAVRKIGSFERPRATGEWYAVNADGSQPRTLIEYGTLSATQRSKAVGNESFSLLDTLREDDVNVVMQVRYPRSAAGVGTEIVLMDTISGRRKSLGRAPRDNCSIALDRQKQPGFAICYIDKDEESGFDTHNEVYKREADGTWTQISSSKLDGARLSIIRSAANGKIYATRDDGRKPAALGVFDTVSGSFNEIFKDDISEVGSVINAVDGSEAIIGVVTEAEAPRVTLVEDQHPDAEIYTSLAAAFPGQLVNFGSSTDDGTQIIVSVRSDQNPGELYLYDRETGKARFLLQNRPWIDAKKMGTIKPINFTTRDGLKIYGYLTLPPGSSGKDLPLIVNVHGGPMGPRDSWGFNRETQLMANRGYAVLQVNYRGSGGFGKAFQDMAYGQWAEGIMNDIIDGTRHVIEKGYVDKDRICIYGGSFGGYASMMAPVRAPGLFQCAFGYVGMYDAQIQFSKSDTGQNESGRRYLTRSFGRTKVEQDAMSPVSHAHKLTLPIYLAAGARDARCPPEHTEAMAKVLTQAGNPPEGIIIQSGEEHGFYKEENNLRLYTEMLGFFDRHIGDRTKAGIVSGQN